jgi:hypothetical protein
MSKSRSPDRYVTEGPAAWTARRRICGFRSSTASIREREVSRSSSGTNDCGSQAARSQRIWIASGRLHSLDH